MKYALYDKETLRWEMVYCGQNSLVVNNENLLEFVAKSMLMGNDYEKFNTEECVCVVGEEIKNDDNIFILSEGNIRFLWQLGSKVTDMTGILIPGLYYVRKIGIVV